nr:Ig-like domain-containing protein [Methylorubrum populi]
MAAVTQTFSGSLNSAGNPLIVDGYAYTQYNSAGVPAGTLSVANFGLSDAQLRTGQGTGIGVGVLDGAGYLSISQVSGGQFDLNRLNINSGAAVGVATTTYFVGYRNGEPVVSRTLVQVLDLGGLLGETRVDFPAEWSGLTEVRIFNGSVLDVSLGQLGFRIDDIVTNDRYAPAIPTLTTDATATQDNTPTLFGTAEAGSTVAIYNGAAQVATVIANSSGQYSFTPSSALADGIYNFSARATDASGNVSGASASVRVTIDTVAPIAPTITATSASTNDNTPTLNGTAEAGSTVAIYSGTTLLGTTVAGANGSFSFTPTTALADGTYSFTARATDASGNTGPASAAISLQIDATAPVAPVFTTGGGLTNDTTPTLTGRAEAGSTVTVYNGSVVLGTTVAAADGSFSFTPATALNEGSYGLTATARDALGNSSPLSAPLGVIIDSVAPGLPTIVAPAFTNNVAPAITGTAEAGSTVTIYNGTTALGTAVAGADGRYAFTPASPLAAGTYTLTATATDPAGNVSARSTATSTVIDLTAPLAPTLTAGTAATADTTPTLTGTAEAGSTVTVFNGAAVLGTAVAGANGTFSFTPTIPLTDGTYSLTAIARDPAGNLGPASAAISLQIDATPPAAPTFLSGGGLTNDSTPTLTGTAEAGSTVTILNGTTVLGTAQADANGAFTFTPTTPLAEGGFALTAVARDAVGNASPASAALSVQIDLTAPTAPVIAPLGPTNSTTPTITGSAEAGSTVTILNGTTVLGTTTALANGTFSFTPPTALVDGTASLTATARDAAGNVSSPSVPVSVTIDTGVPAAPAFNVPSPTNDPTPALTGTAEAGSTVTISSNGTVLGTTVAGADGTFSFTPANALPDGTTNLTATARDAAGNLSPVSAAVALTIDTAAPAAPALASIPLTNDSTPTLTGTAEAGSTVTILNGTTVLGTTVALGNGTFAFTPTTALADGTTSLTATARDAAGNLSGASPAATVTVDTAAPTAPVITPLGPTNSTTPTITGTAEAGSTVTILNGTTVLGTTTALANGTFSLTLTTALADGTTSLTATARDLAGNLSAPSVPLSVTVDATAPGTPVITPLGPTNDTTPTITGTTEAGSTVTISSNGTVLGTTVAGADGTFSFTPADALPDGTTNLTATARDAAGNLSPVSAAVALTIDTAAPAAPALASIPLTNDSTPTLTGTAEAGSTVTILNGTTVLGTTVTLGNGTFAFTPTTALADGTTSLTATARDAAGNLSGASPAATVTVDTAAPGAPVIAPLGPTNSTTPTITGTAEAGSTVTILNGTTVLGTTTALANGTFSLTPTTALADGTTSLTATARDLAGNVSVPSAILTVTVDRTAPGVPAIDPLGLTNDATPTITGTAEAGSTVTISGDGTVLGVVTAGPQGTFSFTPTTGLAEGVTNLTATARDAAGNLSPVSAAVALTIDTAAPAAPALASIPLTNDSTPTITGTAEAGSTVTILNGTTVLGTTVALGNGTFAFTPTTALADGTTSLTATARDAAGNLSGASPAATVTVDTTAPGAPTLAPVTDPPTDTTPTITGSAEAGSTVTIFAGTIVLGTTTALGDNTFSFTPTVPLPNGVSQITATAQDAAGNVSGLSAALEVSVINGASDFLTVDYLPPTNLATPTISGSATAGDTITISLGGTEIGTGTAGADGRFNIAVQTAIPEGPQTLTVVATDTDLPGAVATATLDVLIDLTPPGAPTLAAFVVPTNDPSAVIRGSGAEAGSTVTVTAAAGTIVIGTALADANGNFVVTPDNPLVDGTLSLQATARDVAGNVSLPSNVVELEVDLTPPEVPSVDLLRPTNDTTPTITGSSDPGSVVLISVNGVEIGSTVANGDGTFAFTPGTPLANGAISITATARDTAGNVSAASPAVTGTIDTIPPAVPLLSTVSGSIGDNTPTITGTADPGSTVTLSSNGSVLGTATADQNGQFSFTPLQALADGAAVITATAWDAAGNASAASTAITLTIDTVAPSAPAFTLASGATANNTPTITGTAEALALVVIYNGADELGTLSADANGVFSFTPATPLADGSYTLTATARDAAGNTGPASASITLGIDTDVPQAPAVDPLAPATRDNTPTITGTAEAGSTVTLLNGTTVLGTAIADQNGAFSFTPTTPLGDGTYTLTATATDAAGQVGPASQPIPFTIDTAAPAAPTLTSPGGAVADTTPDITGTGEAGTTVTLFDGATAVGTATVAQNGTFTVSPATPLTQGAHSLTVQLTDAAGNVSAATAPLSVVVDTLPPSAPVITNAGLTNDSTPTITGTAEAGTTVTLSNNGTVLGSVVTDGNGAFSFTPTQAFGEGANQVTVVARDAVGNLGPASAAVTFTVDTVAPLAPSITTAGGLTSDDTPTITGRAEAGTTVTLLNGTTVLGTAIADQNGAFSFTPTIPLGDGTYTLTATATDAAGQVGPASQPVTLTIDSTPPAAPTVTSPGGAVADTTPDITGTGEAGTTVTLFDGATAVGTATVAQNGTFTVSPATPLTQGAHSLTVQLTDAAGNVSAATAPLSVVVDTLPPSAPVITNAGLTNDSTPTITGTAEAGTTVTLSNNGTVLGSVVTDGNGAFSFTPTQAFGEGANQVTVVARDAAGNLGPASAAVTFTVDTAAPNIPNLTPVAGPINDGTPTLTGTADAGATVTLLNGTTVLGTAIADQNGAFSFTPTTPLGDGTYALTATATDAAGNASGTSVPVVLAIDTAAPAAPTLTSPGGAVADTTPDITGTGEAGTTVTLFDGATAVGTATVAQNGTFTVSPATPLTQGTHSLTVQLTDAAGNVSAATAPLSVVVDTLPPSAPVITNAGLTNDSTPTITGTAEAGTTVTLSNNGTVLGSVVTDGNGAFSFTPTQAFGEGANQVTVVARDAAGNLGPASAAVTFTVDTAAPNIPNLTPVAGPINDGTPTLTGTADAGATVTLLNGTTVLGTAIADQNGAFSFTPTTPLGDGTYTLTATATDAAGNASGTSVPVVLAIDTAAPAAPTLTSPGGAVADTTPDITGTGEPGATVTLLNGSSPIGTAVVGADGTFTVSPATPLAEGSYDLAVQLTDAAGNAGAPSAPLSIVVDTQIDAAPAVTFAVETTADGILNAREAAATAFTVTGLDASTTATATFSDGRATVTVTVGADGSYAADLDALDGPVTASLLLTDAAGNTATVSGPTVTLDTSAPVGTAVADTAGGAAVASFTYGVSFSEAVTNVSVDDFVLTGTNGATGTVTGIVGSGGAYTVTVAGVTGTGTLTLALAAESDIADAAGNRATLAAGSRDVTGIPPVLPVITGYTDDTGVPSDGLTRDTTPTLTGIGAAGATVALTAAGAAGTVTATGLVAADGTWSVALPSLAEGAYSVTASLTDAAGSPIGTSAPFALTIDTTVDGGAPATLTVDPTADGVIDAAEAAAAAFAVAGLDPGTSGSVIFTDGIRQTSVAVAADGSYTVDLSGFSGRVTSALNLSDAAGNTSTIAGGTLTLQTGRPGAPVVTGLADDTGALGDGLTGDTTPTLSGLADPGSTIRVTAGAPDGTVTVETQANAAGAWSTTLPSLADGIYAVTAVAIDAAGNVSAASDPFTFGIDASAPNAPVVTAGGGVTSDTTPAIIGTGEPGATVTLLNGSSPIGTAVVDADGTFTVSPTTPLASGSYDLAVQLTDAAGNAGAPSAAIGVVIDTGVPNAPTLAPLDPTNDTTPTITGTAEAGTTVTISNGTNVLGSVVVGPDGSFSFTPTAPLPEGTATLTATAQDAAGNVSAPSATALVTIDTTAPAAPTVTPFPGTTTDTTPTVTGTGEPGSTVTLLEGTTPLGTAIVRPDGTFAVTPTDPFAAGPHNVSVQLTDAAGNISTASDAIEVIVVEGPSDGGGEPGGGTPPLLVGDVNQTLTHAPAVSGNLLANDVGAALRVTAVQFADGRQVAVPGSGTVEVVADHGTLTVSADGSYSYQAIGANNLDYNARAAEHFTYTVTDAAGALAQSSLDISLGGQKPQASADFAFAFTEARVALVGEALTLVGPDGVTRDISGIDTLRFTDGEIQNNDGHHVVDDVFYYANNLDVWRAQVDADTHYETYGWKEGRDPNAYFHTREYLAENPDVAAADINPLEHYVTYGEREGRSPSPNFSAEAYLHRNSDVAAQGINALAHYLTYGQEEGRSVFAGESEGPGRLIGDFDADFYLARYADVAAAVPTGRDAGSFAFEHYLKYGASELRNPNAVFDTAYYLEQNPGVAASGTNPLLHYQEFGWREGANPSASFDTNGYLASHPEVVAAGIDPLGHYLQTGSSIGHTLV